MKIWLLIFSVFILLSCCNLFGQSKDFITVKAGLTIKESISPEELYEYPQFMQGTVFFRNDKSAHALLNYNRFLDELQFINTKGDTLSLINEKDIQFIDIGTDSFFYNQGFIKLITTSGHAKLAIKQTLALVDKEKISDGYGSTSSTGAIDSYNSYYDRAKNYDIPVMQNLILKNKVQYYIGTNSNNFLLAIKKNFLKLFPKQKSNLETYLKLNTINFDNSGDLIKLVQYLGQF